MGFLRRVCTHLFSFERAVPYVPTVRKVTKAVSAKLSVERESEKNTLSGDVSDVEEKSEKEEERRGLDLQRVLEDTRNFVRDDFSKVERALEEPFYNSGADFQSPFGIF